MPIKSTIQATLFATCIALPIHASAEFEPLAGKWERSLTTYMFMHSTNMYAPWQHPKSSSCYSGAALRNMGALSAAGSKSSHEKEGKSCDVSEESKVNATVTWRLLCKTPDGVIEDTRASVVTSGTEVRSSSVLRVAGKGDALGPDGMRAELLMRRIGDCDEKVDIKS